jgi:hypothetical protein
MTTVKPPPGDGSAHRLGEAPGDTEPEPGRTPLTEAPGRGEQGSLGGRGNAGTGVDDPQLDAVGQSLRADRHGRAAEAQGVVHDVGDDPFEEDGVGENLGQELVDVDVDVHRAGLGQGGDGVGGDLLVADRSQARGDGACGQPRGVEQVVDEPDEAVGRLLDGHGELGTVGLGQVQLRISQAGHRGLDRRQRAP